MRRKMVLVAAAVSLALGSSVATADPADARRNLGGNLPAGAVCIDPGAVELNAQAAANGGCLCIAVPEGPTFKNGGRGGECPAGIGRVTIDRNPGG